MENKEVILKTVVLDILKHMPYRPFLCLPLSATLYAILKDNHKIHSRLVTGSLSFNGQPIFKQDFSIINAAKNTLQYWSGHAWIELDDLVCDLSIFRTLYSPEFIKPCKSELIEAFGEGRGCLIAGYQQLNKMGLSYTRVDELDDDMATQIIQGFRSQLDTANK